MAKMIVKVSLVVEVADELTEMVAIDRAVIEQVSHYFEDYPNNPGDEWLIEEIIADNEEGDE